jgi:hypothetical protein
VREFLSHHRVPFVERNIRWNPDAQRELRELTGQLVVPALVVGDEWFLGYDPKVLESLVARLSVE